MATGSSTDEVLRELQEQDRYIPMMNYEAPGFTLEDPRGRKVSLADFRGKVVILSYKARRGCVAPDSGRPVDEMREARDAGSSRPDV